MYENEFYVMEDIKKMTKVSKTTAYKMINDFNAKLKKENPDILILRGRVLKSAWDKQFDIGKGDKNEKEN